MSPEIPESSGLVKIEAGKSDQGKAIAIQAPNISSKKKDAKATSAQREQGLEDSYEGPAGIDMDILRNNGQTAFVCPIIGCVRSYKYALPPPTAFSQPTRHQ